MMAQQQASGLPFVHLLQEDMYLPVRVVGQAHLEYVYQASKVFGIRD